MQQRIFITLFSAAAIAISQLSAFGQTFLTYYCRDGSEFVVAFYEGENGAPQLDGRLWRFSDACPLPDHATRRATLH